MSAAEALGRGVGVSAACAALRVSRATLYRRRQPRAPRARQPSHRALSEVERKTILEVLHSERFRDLAVRQVYGALLGEGKYLASPSTMYRILRASSGARERRNVREHPTYTKPQLVATAPNQVWSWDITRLPGPNRRDWYYLYVVIDIYSRMVVGWMVAEHENATLAKRLLEETFNRQGVGPGQLVIHSDRGAPMTSKTTKQLLSDLDVKGSLSRPRVSNDNPFSESQFKTTKYNPWMPDRFASLEDARVYGRFFFPWYNDEHCHSGIASLPPRVVHEGRATEVLAARQAVLNEAYARHPERFVGGRPCAGTLPTKVTINPAPEAIDLPSAGAAEQDEVLPSGVAEPPPAASVRPSPAQGADRQREANAAERPESPGPTRSAQREHGEDGEDATWRQPSEAVAEVGVRRSEAAGRPVLAGVRQ